MAADPKRDIDAEARAAVEGTNHGTVQPGNSAADAPEPSDDRPPAGAHADPTLTNPLSTPGTGALTPPGGHDDVDSTSS
jgi:hypothetical protein